MAQPRDESRTTGSGSTRTGQRTDTEQRTPLQQERPGGLSRRDSLIPWIARDPFTLFDTMQRQMDRMFQNFGFGSMERNLWSPQIEMHEKKGKLLITADLPGLNKEDVKIELNDNLLTIEGERKQEQRDDARGWSERSYGRFFRSIPLPEGINAENANASFNNGVLEITLDAPKKELPKGKKIEIQ